MNKKQKYIPGIGLVDFVKNRRAKYVNISISPPANVRVTLPYYSTYKYAEAVLLEKRNWVCSKIEKVSRVAERLTIFTEETNFTTKFHSLKIRRSNLKNLRSAIAKELLIISIPNQVSIESDFVQQFIRNSIVETYRIEAKKILPERVKKFAEQLNISIHNIYIKNMKSQWGSCSRRKNINLNLHLMRLPDELIDYVILHELTHITEMNHSKKFWELLEKRLHNSKFFDKKIKEFSINFW